MSIIHLSNVQIQRLLEARINDFVSLEGRYEDIEAPEEDKDAGRDSLHALGTTKLPTNSRVATEQQDEDSQKGFNTEDSHREAQAET